MTEYTDGIESGTPRTAENTSLAHGECAAFFERNKGGITHVNYETRTYFVLRSWKLLGPVPRGTRIEHMGLANSRRAGSVKRRKQR